MTPEALNADANATFEAIIPAIVVVEIEAKADERFEAIVPAIVTQEIG